MCKADITEAKCYLLKTHFKEKKIASQIYQLYVYMRCKQVLDKFVLYVIYRKLKICISIIFAYSFKYQVLTKEEQKSFGAFPYAQTSQFS